MQLIELDPETRTVGILDQGVALDLGGIGKGFALDRALQVSQDWDIERALFHGGQSTMAVIGSPPGAPGWMMRLRDPRNEEAVLAVLHLAEAAISASARDDQIGILDPQTERTPETGWFGTWAIAGTAMEADALSTAFMVMSAEQIENFCNTHEGVCAILVGQSGDRISLTTFGPVDTFGFERNVEL